MIDREELASRIFVAFLEQGYEKIMTPGRVTSPLPSMAKVALDAADTFIRIAGKFPADGLSQEDAKRLNQQAKELMGKED